MSDVTGRPAPERACLRIQGSDARTVLQGVVTNDVDRLAPGRALYAALLSPQGKYLFDFFLVDPGDGALLIDAAADRAAALVKRLGLYCLRRDAKVLEASDLAVGQLWSAGGAELSPALPDGCHAVPDPRSPRLGWRIYAADPEAVLRALGAAPVGRSDYDALRVAEGVPESGVELVPDETFILEAGFERLNGVDFRKGCYVGQEVTARMKHKTALRKGLVAVSVEGAAEPGTEIVTGEGKPAGRLFTQAGGRGLAHLRFDRAGGALTAGEARVTADGVAAADG